MKFLIQFLIIFGSSLICAQFKSSVSIQSGLIHSFFDNTPLINFKHTSKDQGIFHGVHLGSVGVDYNFQINPKNALSIEFNRLYNTYQENWYNHKLGDICSRDLRTFYLKYQRNLSISAKTNLNFGVGLSYRIGDINMFTVNGTNPSDYIARYVEDNYALNTFVGLNHPLNKRFSIFYKLDLRSIVYYVNREELFTYPELHPGYPNRFDLSLKLGLSFHF
jgi:hypothetical protein